MLSARNELDEEMHELQRAVDGSHTVVKQPGRKIKKDLVFQSGGKVAHMSTVETYKKPRKPVVDNIDPNDPRAGFDRRSMSPKVRAPGSSNYGGGGGSNYSPSGGGYSDGSSPPPGVRRMG